MAMGIALLLGAWISLTIELLQEYLPTRDSSLTDVLNNILGIYIGARLFQASRDILYR
jgi:VanZ family protein